MTSPIPPSSSAAPGAERICPACQSPASGKFCSNCGATLAPAACASCGAPLSPAARFCHRCGTPAGAEGTEPPRSFSAALPWGVAAIALVALIALVAGQRFSHAPANPGAGGAPEAPGNVAPFAGATGNGVAPDISNMTPAEAAVRLYNRVMEAHENQHQDTVQMFAPMAITAYSMLGKLDLDAHYDVGRIAAVSGDSVLAGAEADTILAQHPDHLLGLILAGNAARMRRDTAAERRYYDELVAAAPTERAKQLPEYVTHENDITIALDAKRP